MRFLAKFLTRGEMLTTGPEQHTVEMLEPRLLLSSAPLPLPLNELDLGPVAWLTEPVSRGTTPGAADTGDPAGGDSATGIVISGVPAYYWYRGCGPTSAGMIIGYWDGHGYSNLVVGDCGYAERWEPGVDVHKPPHLDLMPAQWAVQSFLAFQRQRYGCGHRPP